MEILRLEYFKIRRKKIGIMIIMILSIEMIWAFISVSKSMEKQFNPAIWESLIYTVNTMNGLFLPILVSIVVSRICDMEHKGKTWKLLMATDVRPYQLYAAKYILANSLLLFGIFVQAVWMMGFVLIKGFSNIFPSSLLFEFIGGTLLTTCAITALQQWISLVIKNQAFSLCLGTIGGLIGITSGLFPDTVRHIFIWSYYLDLSSVAMLYHNHSTTFITQTLDLRLVFVVIICTVVFYLVGMIHMQRQEI